LGVNATGENNVVVFDHHDEGVSMGTHPWG